LREQAGEEYQTNRFKNLENQNSQVLVNAARVYENEAKRKEQLLSVKSSLNMENSKQINKM
jgi:hypothetical protein